MIEEKEYLYHFTSTWHIGKILDSGFLKLTDSNLLPPTGDAKMIPIGEINGKPAMQYQDSASEYKPVVWLTRDESPSAHSLGLNENIANKIEIRITILKKPEYEPWKLFADKNRMKTSWRKNMERGRNPSSWYICECEIPLSAFIKIENIVTGETIYPPESII